MVVCYFIPKLSPANEAGLTEAGLTGADGTRTNMTNTDTQIHVFNTIRIELRGGVVFRLSFLI